MIEGGNSTSPELFIFAIWNSLELNGTFNSDHLVSMSHAELPT